MNIFKRIVNYCKKGEEARNVLRKIGMAEGKELTEQHLFSFFMREAATDVPMEKSFLLADLLGPHVDNDGTKWTDDYLAGFVDGCRMAMPQDAKAKLVIHPGPQRVTMARGPQALLRVEVILTCKVSPPRNVVPLQKHQPGETGI